MVSHSFIEQKMAEVEFKRPKNKRPRKPVAEPSTPPPPPPPPSTMTPEDEEPSTPSFSSSVGSSLGDSSTPSRTPLSGGGPDEDESGGKKRTKKSRLSTVSESTKTQMKYGVTRQQRHVVLDMMVKAVPSIDAEVVQKYMTTLEKRLFDALLGAPMHAAYNLYRGETYRRFSFEIIWALRANGPELMGRFPPELLASVPAHVLCENTPAGRIYKEWYDKKEHDAMVVNEMRHERDTEKGEGAYKCPKCAGRFDMRMLQTRSGDEGMTLYYNCRRCGFVKKK